MSLWNSIFGTRQAEEGKPPVETGSAGPTMEVFVMGVNVEEIYIIFGEQLQNQLGGLPHELYAAAERKINKIRETLARLGLPAELSAAFTPIRARIERRRLGSQPTPEEITEEIGDALKTAGEISRLMGVIRSHLDDAKGLQYDIGIFLARLSLCARTVRASAELQTECGAKMGQIYTQEMGRAAAQFGRIVLTALHGGVLNRSFGAIACERLVSLAANLANDAAYTPAGAASTEKHVEEVLSAVGFSTARAGV